MKRKDLLQVLTEAKLEGYIECDFCENRNMFTRRGCYSPDRSGHYQIFGSYGPHKCKFSLIQDSWIDKITKGLIVQYQKYNRWSDISD